VREVAARLASLASSEPVGRVEDMGGPEVLTVDELMRTYLAATGRRARIWTIPAFGPLKLYVDGGHLTPSHATGRLTFAEWLQHRTPH
jgi:uncharacterized protein YbjT (DUF2867 family)